MTTLQRGSVPLQRGDLCAQRAQILRAEADERAGALDRACIELRDPNTQLVWLRVEGRSGEYPVPREVAEHLATAKRSAR
jgi:hypothetical protein